jgi:hypothetical protein
VPATVPAPADPASLSRAARRLRRAAALQAARLAALPEVWHASVRAALVGFTASFGERYREPAFAGGAGGGGGGSGAGWGEGAGTYSSSSFAAGPRAAALSPAEAAAAKAGARLHLRTLAACARLAADCGMASGVDIIVAVRGG